MKRGTKTIITAAVVLTAVVFASTSRVDAKEEKNQTKIPTRYVTENLPAVRDQGDYNLSYAFCAMSLAEICTQMKYGVAEDYSEASLFAMFMNSQDFSGAKREQQLEAGSSLLYTTMELAKGNGLQLEVDYPYTEENLLGEGASNDAKSMIQLRNAVVYDWKLGDAGLKELILECGAAGIEIGDSEWVTIVGWDDNYSASNFGGGYSKNGAWLVRDSHGTGGEQGDGYFWISYYDTVLSEHPVAYLYDFAREGSEEYYDNIYQYDRQDNVDFLWSDDGEVMAANVFQAKGFEELKAVMVGIGSCNTDITVQVYRDVKQGYSVCPDDGKLAEEVAVHADYEGIYTIELDEAILLEPNERYSIVVTLTCDGIPVMLTSAKMPEDESHSNIPWCSSFEFLQNENGEYAWYDVLYLSNKCPRIKACTNKKVIDLKDAEIEVNSDQFVYSGQRIDLQYAVKYKDLDITGSFLEIKIEGDLVNAGTVKIKVKAQSGYNLVGKIEKKIVIKKKKPKIKVNEYYIKNGITETLGSKDLWIWYETQMCGCDYPDIVVDDPSILKVKDGCWFEILKPGTTTLTFEVNNPNYVHEKISINVRILPETVENIVASNQKDGIHLSWDKVSTADGYIVYRKELGGKYQKYATISTNKASFVDKKVKTGDWLYYKVCATAKGVKGEFSEEIAITAAKKLERPKLFISNVEKGLRIKVRSNGAEKYIIYRKAENGEWVKIGSSDEGGMITDTKVKANKKYTYAAKAYNGSVVSSLSAAYSYWRVKPQLVLKAQNKDSGILFSWEKMKGAIEYHVNVFVKEGVEYDYDVSGTSLLFKKQIKEGAHYSVSVQAKYKPDGKHIIEGNFLFINALRVKSVKDVKTSSNKSGAISLKWKKNTKVTGYQIQYSTKSDFSKDVKTLTVNSSTAASRSISNLKKGKNYYVRIRSYIQYYKLKDYSAWSKASKVKVKK